MWSPGALDVWPEKSRAVEMNQMSRVAGAPDFSFPSNPVRVFAHDDPIGERRNENEISCRSIEETRQLAASRFIHMTAIGDRVNQHESIALTIKKHHVGHVGVRIHLNPGIDKRRFIDEAAFPIGVARKNQRSGRKEVRAENLNDASNELVSRGELHMGV